MTSASVAAAGGGDWLMVLLVVVKLVVVTVWCRCCQVRVKMKISHWTSC